MSAGAAVPVEAIAALRRNLSWPARHPDRRAVAGGMAIDANGFDRNFYLARNPDVAAGQVPYRHYRDYGWREERDPSATFSLSKHRAVMMLNKEKSVSASFHD